MNKYQLIKKVFIGVLILQVISPFLGVNILLVGVIYTFTISPFRDEVFDFLRLLIKHYKGEDIGLTPEKEAYYNEWFKSGTWLNKPEMYIFIFIFLVVGFFAVWFIHKKIKKTLLFFLLPVSPIVHIFIVPFILFKKNKRPNKTVKNVSGVILETTKGKLIINNPFRGILVVGGNGSGKSESVVIPCLSEFISKNYCGIVYDFKYPTLANDVDSLKLLHLSELPHYRLDFDNPLKSHRVNPIKPGYLKNSSVAREAALTLVSNLMKESITKPNFWSRGVTDILTACIWFLKRERPEYCTLPHVCHLINSDFTKVMQLLQSNIETSVMINSISTAMQNEAGNQLAGVVGTLQSAIAQINTPEIMYIFGGNDFDLNINDPDNPKILTVGTNSSTPEVYAPVCSLVIKMGIKLMNQKEKHKSFIVLDEAPTVYIPDLQQLPNTGRSNDIATLITCQDLQQFTDGYGKVKSDVLFGSCNNHFYGSVSNSLTADVLSKQFGKKDKIYTTMSNNRQNLSMYKGSQGKGQSVQEREVLKAAEIKEFKQGEFAGHLVEGEGFFREQFLMIDRPNVPGSTIEKEDSILSDYQRTKNEIDALLN